MLGRYRLRGWLCVGSNKSYRPGEHVSRRASRTSVIARDLALTAELWQAAPVPTDTDLAKLLLTVQDVAQLLRISPLAVYRRVTRGTIPARCVVPDFRPLRFYANEIHAMVGLAPSTGSEVKHG